MARDRVAAFVRQWRRKGGSSLVGSLSGAELWVEDLDVISKPRQVVRTLGQLQGLPKGTKLAVQGDRAAQVEGYDDVDDNGELIEVKKLIYVGTDLDDYLAPPDRLTRETLDTLRRMLPAVVIDPVD